MQVSVFVHRYPKVKEMKHLPSKRSEGTIVIPNAAHSARPNFHPVLNRIPMFSYRRIALLSLQGS